MEKFQSYQCPNCGRIYNYGRDDLENRISCDNCRHLLKKIENIKNIKHPELNPMFNNKHVIGEVNNFTNSKPKCPYCQSTNIKKISTINRMVSTGLFGLASSKIGKTHKCNNCGTTW